MLGLGGLFGLRKGMRFFPHFHLLIFILAALSLSPAAEGAEGDLSSSPYWRKLLHATPGLLGWRSEVESPEFFLHPKGKEDLELELQASIKALQAPAQPDHAQCRFPARLLWLRAQLPHILWPRVACTERDQWLLRHRPKGLSLIYASSFFGNPASAFGHLFLKLERPADGIATPVVQFGAAADDAGGFAYVFKGVFGGFDGYYSIEPYHILMRSNLELEDRNLISYKLRFSAEERERILLHLWEMRGVNFDYYFFKQNCGLRLAELIELAWWDGREIKKSRLFWSIPTEVFKEIAQQDWSRQGDYLASRGDRFRFRVGLLSGLEQYWYELILEDPLQLEAEGFLALPEGRRAVILDAAHDALRLKLNSNLARIALLADLLGLEEKNAAARVSRMKILGARSKLDAPPPPLPPLSNPPQEGHGSARLGLAGGRYGELNYEQFKLWGAYHDLLGNPVGYLPDSDLRVMELVGEKIGEDWHLGQLTLVEATALSPRTSWTSPLSWHFGMVLKAPWEVRCQDCYALETSFHLGGAWETEWMGRELLYILPGLVVQTGKGMSEQGRLGGEMRAGLIFHWHARFSSHLSWRQGQAWAGAIGREEEAAWENRLILSQNWELRLDGARKGEVERWLAGLDWAF